MNHDLSVESVNEVTDFDRIAEKRIRELLSILSIDLDVVTTDLQKLAVPASDSIDPNVLCTDLQKVQASKERAVEIVRVMTHAYLTYKRVVEILTKGWPKYSPEKSAEKREGEALLKFSNLIMAANDVECVYRHALGVMRNLENQQESLSEQINCARVSARLGQMASWNGDNVTDWRRFDQQEAKAEARSETDNDKDGRE